VPDDWAVDVIEINPDMAKANAHFRPYLSKGLEDPRVTLIVQEGFRFFRAAAQERAGGYDAVIMDVAMGEGLSVAHLLTVEMFVNIAATLDHDGVFALWTAEPHPFTPVSLTLYKTMQQAGFHKVFVKPVGTTVFLSPMPRNYMLEQEFTEIDRALGKYVSTAGEDLPPNMLDTLPLNRMPYDHQAF